MSENLITMTVEELECLKEEASKRADELEWKLRMTLTKLRELEQSILAAIGESAAPVISAPTVRAVPAVRAAAPEVRASYKAPEIRSAPGPVVVPVRTTPTSETPALRTPVGTMPPAPPTSAKRPTLMPVPAPAVASATRIGPPPPPPAALASGSSVKPFPKAVAR